MDGVIFDTHPVHLRVWRQLLQDLGMEVSDEELDFIMDGATREEILRHFLGPLTVDQIAMFGKQKDGIFLKEEKDLLTVTGLGEFLDLAETLNISKAVATSASKVRANRMLSQHGLTGRFVAVVTADDVPKGKSDPTIFLQAAKELQVSPPDVLVLEDAVPAIRVAKEIGMRCIGIARGTRTSRLLEAGADLVVPDFRPLGRSDILGPPC